MGAAPLLISILSLGRARVNRVIRAARDEGVACIGVMAWPLVAFLVKLPLTGVHIWLPKAHVEAPVVGSIFLAAVLLKLGGWGLILFQELAVNSTFSQALVGLSLLGVVWVSVICCQTVDSKTLIAFSSVTHIRMVVFGVALGTSAGITTRFLVLLRHGFSSSVAFLLVFYLYKSQNSRRLVLTKSLLAASGGLNAV